MPLIPPNNEPLVTPPQPPVLPQAPQDLSPRVVDLARVIDRLPPGDHIIQLHKPDVRAMDWKVEVLNVQHSRSMTLPKRRSENGQ